MGKGEVGRSQGQETSATEDQTAMLPTLEYRADTSDLKRDYNENCLFSFRIVSRSLKSTCSK